MGNDKTKREFRSALKLTATAIQAQQIAGMLESSPQSFALHYTDARLSIFNEAFAKLLGYSCDELSALNWELITPAKWVEGEKEKLAELHRTGVPVRYEKEYIRKNGELVPVELYMNLHLNQQGQVDYHYAFITDITMRKGAEELRIHIERIIQHDLRGPASAAIQLAGLLRDETSTTKEQRQHLIGLFEQTGQDMLDTLDNSLMVYKMEICEYKASLEPFDCFALVQKIFQTVAKNEEFSCVHMDILHNGLHTTTEARCICLGEPKLLRSALRNLLRNAQEAAAPDGYVIVNVSSHTNCRITIRNRGAVPTEIRDKFFDKYVTEGKASGTGIGTYSARMMVRAQGGDITMSTSDQDNETVVTVSMGSTD